MHDHHQGKWLAAKLQEKIVEAARQNGFVGLYAMIFPDNKTMIKFFNKQPYRINTRFDEKDLLMQIRFAEPAESAKEPLS